LSKAVLSDKATMKVLLHYVLVLIIEKQTSLFALGKQRECEDFIISTISSITVILVSRKIIGGSFSNFWHAFSLQKGRNLFVIKCAIVLLCLVGLTSFVLVFNLTA
jgi:hypothetical protein